MLWTSTPLKTLLRVAETRVPSIKMDDDGGDDGGDDDDNHLCVCSSNSCRHGFQHPTIFRTHSYRHQIGKSIPSCCADCEGTEATKGKGKGRSGKGCVAPWDVEFNLWGFWCKMYGLR